MHDTQSRSAVCGAASNISAAFYGADARVSQQRQTSEPYLAAGIENSTFRRWRQGAAKGEHKRDWGRHETIDATVTLQASERAEAHDSYLGCAHSELVRAIRVASAIDRTLSYESYLGPDLDRADS